MELKKAKPDIVKDNLSDSKNFIKIYEDHHLKNLDRDNNLRMITKIFNENFNIQKIKDCKIEFYEKKSPKELIVTLPNQKKVTFNYFIDLFTAWLYENNDEEREIENNDYINALFAASNSISKKYNNAFDIECRNIILTTLVPVGPEKNAEQQHQD